MRTRVSGFTLIELLVAIAIIAILAAIAAPNFTGMIKANRVQSQMRELYGQLQYARSEAISRSQRVTVCSSNNGTACGGAWSNGLMICVDVNRNASCDASETILRKYADMGNNVLSVANDAGVAQDHISFNKNGTTDIANNMTFSICDVDKDVKYARAILKVGAGQILYSAPNASGIYKDVNQAALACP